MLSRAKRKFLVDVIGEERVKEIEEGLSRKARHLESLGVDFKELGDLLNGAVNGKIVTGTADRKLLTDDEKGIDWTPRRQEPASTEETKESKEPAPSPAAPYAAMLTGEQEGG